MTPMEERVHVWGIVPAAGMSRRMGRTKQSLPHRDSTIVGVIVRTLLDAGLRGLVVVTRTDLVTALDLPNDPRLDVAINDDAESEMVDSIRIALARLPGVTYEDDQNTEFASRAEQLDPRAASTRSPLAARHSLLTTDGVLVVPADMPALTVQTCRTCTEAFDADPERIVIATHHGKRGHPIIFPLGLREAINELQGGLRMLPRIHAERVLLVEVNDPGAVHDIDTPKEYDEL